MVVIDALPGYGSHFPPICKAELIGGIFCRQCQAQFGRRTPLSWSRTRCSRSAPASNAPSPTMSRADVIAHIGRHHRPVVGSFEVITAALARGDDVAVHGFDAANILCDCRSPTPAKPSPRRTGDCGPGDAEISRSPEKNRGVIRTTPPFQSLTGRVRDTH